MKLAFLTSIAIHFLAKHSVSADDNAPGTPNANPLGSKETPHPIILADVMNGNGSSGDRLPLKSSSHPDYCSDDPDYDCYEYGIPRCCIPSSLRCPKKRPGCENFRRIGPNQYCNARKDVCVDGYACVDGVCQGAHRAVIGQGGVCRAIDTCVHGTACIDRRCSVPLIKPGRYCRAGIDTCVDGYSCFNGSCSLRRSRVVRRGGVCQPGVDDCEGGYSCVDGRCTAAIDAGGVCQPGVDVCISGYSCIDGRCAVPPIQAGGACRSGIDNCVDGFYCINDICESTGWYTNWSYCIMDCPSSSGSCCGGTAQSWDVLYPSVDSCCSQSALKWKYDACVQESQSCAR